MPKSLSSLKNSLSEVLQICKSYKVHRHRHSHTTAYTHSHAHAPSQRTDTTSRNFAPSHIYSRLPYTHHFFLFSSISLACVCSLEATLSKILFPLKHTHKALREWREKGRRKIGSERECLPVAVVLFHYLSRSRSFPPSLSLHIYMLVTSLSLCFFTFCKMPTARVFMFECM